MSNVGGGGKTHVQLLDVGLQGVLYVAPSYELLSDKVERYSVSGMVKAVVLGDNEQAWRKAERYYSTFVYDEVSEWTVGYLRKAIQRYPHHQHVLCGDPGYQLGPVNEAEPLGAHHMRSFGYPITRYDWSHRCKCEALRTLQTDLRSAIDVNLSSEEMGEMVRAALPVSQVVTFEQCVALYELVDTVLVSTHASGQDYTAAITPIDGERKYRIGKHAPLPNGRIVIAHEPPCPQAVETYASTIHGFQGRDVVAPARLFIDSRREHWYVAVTRVNYLSQVFLVLPPAAPAAEPRWVNIYVIRSPYTPLVYIGYTKLTLPARFQIHRRTANASRRCSSYRVLNAGEAHIELLENWPCRNKQEAEERERWWIERFAEFAVNER